MNINLRRSILIAAIAASLSFATIAAQPEAQNRGAGNSGCSRLPTHAQLKDALSEARQQSNGGFNLDMWATIVNRDGVVDVQDIQAVVAGMEDAGGPAESDVNADGAVDVRDLQRVVAEQVLGIEPSPDRDSPKEPAVPAPAAPQARVFLTTAHAVEFVLARLAQAPAAPAFEVENDVFPTQHDYRALLGLSQNAPPRPA